MARGRRVAHRADRGGPGEERGGGSGRGPDGWGGSVGTGGLRYLAEYPLWSELREFVSARLGEGEGGEEGE